MIKSIVLPTTLALAALVSFSAHSSPNDVVLAQQCQTIANKISDLADIQSDPTCEFFLNNAGFNAGMSGNGILNEEFPESKRHLKNSIKVLGLAETRQCVNSVEISLAKNELEQIDAKIKG